MQAVSVGISARSRFLLYGMTRAAREARTLRPDAAGPRDSRGRLSPQKSERCQRKRILRFARNDKP